MQELNIDFYKLLSALSTALDFGGKRVMRHHIRVALIAQRIADELELDENEVNNVIYASMIHDAGASTFEEKAQLGIFELEGSYDHCTRGHWLMELSPLLKPLSKILLCHHDRWDGKNETGLVGEDIPLASRIIHISDRVDVLIDEGKYILHQSEAILDQIKGLAGVVFDPHLVEVLQKLAQKESFWLDLTSGQYEKILASRVGDHNKTINLEELLGIGEVFARIIDGKSRFTHRHSRLVSAVAGHMAMLVGYSNAKCQAIQVAGLLHDLGKLAVPEKILEKPGRLTDEEYKVIKAHTYHTYRILDMVRGFEEINEWASYHHECLHGKGYPFGIGGGNLSAEARMMAVSDIFAALVEERPYRRGLPRGKVEKILLEKVERKDLDLQWVELLLDNYKQLVVYKEKISE
jgi:HD-GYP domain-containing protein (c-di-GMP phosphodiesterase class II)